jgi:protein-tyrosine phosphatase
VIELENLTDIRDIGGWKTVDGSTVKQGMLYRGCELDGATVDGSRITDGGVETMQQLQIRTVIDLRAAESEEKQDMLGKDVEHQSVPFPLYADFFRYSSQTAVKAVFEELAQEDNYPLYLHCNYGMDRTGIACYVLEALLGMSEEDCYREWELSVFAYDDSNVEVFEEFVTQFRAQEGKTLQNKAENYLLEIGITQDQINSIRAILLQ